MEIKRAQPIMENLFRFLILLFILVFPACLGAEIQVEIAVPQLRDGMEELEALLAENIGDAAVEIENLVNNFLEKPEFTRAFGSAVSMSATLPMLGTQPLASTYSFSLGAYASLYSYTLDVQLISDRLSELNPEEDFEFGGSARLINGSFTFPLEKVLPRLSLFASIGYSDVKSEDYYLKDFFLQTALGYAVFKDLGREDRLSWTPVYIQGGGAYGFHDVGTNIPVGEIIREFEADPDGNGPLPPQDVSILLDPVLDIGMRSNIGCFSFSATTGVSLFNSFHFYLGAGCNLSFGRTDILLSGDNEVTVLGYLGDLVDVPGSISVDGSVEGSSPRPFLGYFFTGIQFDISRMFINIPILILPGKGLSSGISLGVSL
ncbi:MULTISPECIES: hypothetical protein [unclassified Oceanispirochaeta]|uniref:hypothetical protein n=1 Tax=unclassified Oceanispirochaeta TaxID=2635722 RepID=UPI000E09443D|nr:MULTISPECIES: hypothetical protein [unclassified Oceanispirochaeta]MBF9017932.1 hypothetical protein [Oceanispirochaeta sp. M2]NPD74443.1 hypothetical protein [Oceanispirochaeta sp. M1]RDG29744.1 hypothetical protein DV872_20280 [Oceanispirochaeta sp. M1]